MPDDLIVRPYRSGDETQLVALFNRSFSKPIDEAEWRWRVKTRPSAVETVFVVTDGDRIVAEHAGIAHRFATPRGVLQGMGGAHAITDAAYRGRRLLYRVGTYAYERWREAGVAFVSGAPNPAWGSTAQRLGWRPYADLVSLIRPLSLSRIAAQRLRLPRALFSIASRVHDRALPRLKARDVVVDEVAVVDEAFDELFERIREDYPVTIVRDAAWVRWRFLDAPARFAYRVLAARRHQRLVGYAVHRIDRDDLTTYVPELVTRRRDEDTTRALLGAIEERSRAQGMVKIQVPALAGSHQAQRLRRLGFWFARDRLPLMFSTLTAAATPVVTAPPTDWLMTGGDYDAH